MITPLGGVSFQYAPDDHDAWSHTYFEVPTTGVKAVFINQTIMSYAGREGAYTFALGMYQLKENDQFELATLLVSKNRDEGAQIAFSLEGFDPVFVNRSLLENNEEFCRTANEYLNNGSLVECWADWQKHKSALKGKALNHHGMEEIVAGIMRKNHTPAP